jgi:hypothetical protein
VNASYTGARAVFFTLSFKSRMMHVHRAVRSWSLFTGSGPAVTDGCTVTRPEWSCEGWG